MTTLPAHRRIAAGRTWPSMYRPESFHPISHYHRTERRATWAIVAICIVFAIGVLTGVM